MLRILDRSGVLCDGWRRRDLLQATMLSLMPWTSTTATATTTPPLKKAKACIVLFLLGGPPHQSLWDLKPDAPEEIRGEFAPIATKVPGITIGELLPLTARWTHRLAILRAVTTGDNAHSSSGYAMLTGQPHTPLGVENANPGPPNNWPTLGAVVQHLSPDRRLLPAAIRLPMHIFNTDLSVWPGQDAGWLGPANDPWMLRCEPASPSFSSQSLQFDLVADVSLTRLEQRKSLLEQLEEKLRGEERRTGHPYEALRAQAIAILSEKRTREACRLDLEPESVRARYGNTQFGQSVLLARRLIEAGVEFVHVNWFRGHDEPPEAPCWDTHHRESQRLRQNLVPPFDQAFSALLEDLECTGRLDETLVIVVAEFGRTPRIVRERAGRDHWGMVFSVVMAGAGIRGGTVHGASDKHAAYPLEGVVTPADYAATLFYLLGINPHTEIRDPLNRPMPISRGEVIRAILA